MSVTGFLVDGQIQKYDYGSLDNLPDIPENSGVFWATYNSTSEAEITNAFSNNKSVMMKYGNDIFSVMRKLSIGPSGSAWLFVSVGQTDIRTTWVSGSYWNTFSTNAMGGDISNNLKQALLQLASKVVYIDEYGQTYYNDLYNALYPKELISISATFNQGSNIIYDIDPLTVLNQYLTVVANYSDGTTETISSSDYTLSGNLSEGVSTITVYYEGFTDTFNVNVTHMAGYYTIVNNLTGCTTNNSATAIQENTSYTATITASAGYTLSGATATITMGGNILTGVFSNGTISIPNVTGDLVITVVASTVTLSSISAVYTQSGTVYDTDTLDSLKADLVVTAHYSDSSTQTIPAADYTLSGTLTAGTSTITVSYSEKTTTFTVTVTEYVVEIPTEGLLGYWDFRNLEAIPTSPVAADQGTARIVRFNASASDQYGLTKSTSAWAFNFSGGTSYSNFPVPFTIAGLSHDPKYVMSIWGNNGLVAISNIARFAANPYYKNSGGTTKNVRKDVPVKSGAAYTSLIITVDNDSIDYYVDGELVKTWNTADLEDFASWSYTTMTYGNTGNGTNVTALGMWNRKLSAAEVMDVQEVFLSLEVTE